MRLISYRHGGKASWGVATDEGIVDVGARLGAKYPTLTDAIAAGALDEVRAAAEGEVAYYGLDEVEYRLPIPAPQKIFCAGRNYRLYHEVKEDGRPKFPSIFPRFPSSFAAHNQAILRPKVSDQLDYEGELGVIIGRRGRHIPEERALDHVVGYTCMNEGSVRDWQSKGTQNTPGKNFYRSGSMGPWIVTADEIADPMKLHLVTRLNGKTVQDSGTDMMIFDVAFLISHVSKFTWLEPGDMFATGSPGGSIIESESKTWMKPGDVLEVEIEGVGTLRNPVAAEE